MSNHYDLDDIRLYPSIRTSRKFKRLRRTVGIGAMQYLTWLWAEVAEKRPDSGDISDWNPFDVADICEFEGDPDLLYNALVDCGFIDLDGSGRATIHNWHERQPHVTNKPQRVLKARMAAAKRWNDSETYTRLYNELYGSDPDPDASSNAQGNATSNATSMDTPQAEEPDKQRSNATSNASSNAPLHTTTLKEESTTTLCKGCSRPFTPRESWHELCDPCFKSKSPATSEPTHVSNLYKTCPYCGYTSSYVNVSHVLKGCNACMPEDID